MRATGSCKDQLPGNSLTGTLFRWEEDEIPRLVNVVKGISKFVKEANLSISMLHGITDFKNRPWKYENRPTYYLINKSNLGINFYTFLQHPSSLCVVN